jgi:hypothetical protein
VLQASSCQPHLCSRVRSCWISPSSRKMPGGGEGGWGAMCVCVCVCVCVCWGGGEGGGERGGGGGCLLLSAERSTGTWAARRVQPHDLHIQCEESRRDISAVMAAAPGSNAAWGGAVRRPAVPRNPQKPWCRPAGHRCYFSSSARPSSGSPRTSRARRPSFLTWGGAYKLAVVLVYRCLEVRRHLSVQLRQVSTQPLHALLCRQGNQAE